MTRSADPKFPLESRRVVRLLRAVNVCFARIYHRLHVHSPQRLPRAGAAILICNHTSGLDPLLIQAVSPRLITWMMAKEYYNVAGLGWAFRTIGAIPVERSGRDLSSTRSAMRALAGGAILGLFPEGRIETTRDLLPFQTGVALLAIKTGVPVFPAYLDGTQRGREIIPAVLRPCSASIAFGPEVIIDRADSSRQTLAAATEKIVKAVEDLRDKYTGVDLR